MALKDFKMVDEIFHNAKRLRAITPYSFRLFFDKMEIFNPFGKRHKENFDKYKPESILCLPILPSEIFYITYNNLLKCPDRRCENFIDKKELEEYNEMCDNGEGTVNDRIKREGHFSDKVLRTSNYDSEQSGSENGLEPNCETFGRSDFAKENNDYLVSEGNDFNEHDHIALETEGELLLFNIHSFFFSQSKLIN